MSYQSHRMALICWLFLISLFATTASAQAVPRFERGDCPFPAPDPDMWCGTMYVPEDYSNPASQTLEIAVAVLPAHTAPLPDPVFYLVGGPGSTALLSVDFWIDHPLRVNRDLILFDQRGAGFSKPNLNCPEIDFNERGNFTDPLSACRFRLKDIVDLSQYHSANNARDVNALREALGYDVINLYGISYGTRLALTVVRDYPDTVRAAVLDGVYPPEVDFLGERTGNRLIAFRALFDACRANAECNNRYPNLEETFYSLLEKYNDEPYELKNPSTYYYVPEIIFGDSIAHAFFEGLYRTESLGVLPYGIDQFAKARTEPEIVDAFTLINGQIPLSYLRGEYEQRTYVWESDEVQAYLEEVGEISISEGMNLSVDCAEEFIFSDADGTVRDNYENVPVELREFLINDARFTRQRCATWNVTRQGDIESQRVYSDTPTLLISGAFDPITSVTWAVSAAVGLPNSRHVVFTTAGHGSSNNIPCARTLVTAHFNAPYLQPQIDCMGERTVQFWIGQ